jgi:hypothetical protein
VQNSQLITRSFKVIGVLELTLIQKILMLIKFKVFVVARWKKLYNKHYDVQFNSQDLFLSIFC